MHFINPFLATHELSSSSKKQLSVLRVKLDLSRNRYQTVQQMLADNVKEVKLLLGIVETVKRTVKDAKI